MGCTQHFLCRLAACGGQVLTIALRFAEIQNQFDKKGGLEMVHALPVMLSACNPRIIASLSPPFL